VSCLQVDFFHVGPAVSGSHALLEPLVRSFGQSLGSAGNLASRFSLEILREVAAGMNRLLQELA
jgi:hypothetical protein